MTWEFFSSKEHLIPLSIALGIFLLFLVFRRIFTKYIFKLLLRISKKISNGILPSMLTAFERPMHWFFIIIGFYVAMRYYPYFNHEQLIIMKWLKSIVIFLVSWGLVRLVSQSSQFFQFLRERLNIELDEILIPFLSRLLQTIVVAIALTIILQEFNYQIGGLITGLGIGGLAVSLAAKDALANLFGGVVIVTEKPFTIDDWIYTPSVEGTVEDISFRSTKVRTFAQALVTVPNATLANEPITNWSKMGKRRITYTLRIAYETPPETIKLVVDEINTLLRNHKDIHQETIFVRANDFSDNGVDIMLYFFTVTTVWGEYLAVRENVQLAILKVLEKYEVEVAIPSRKLYTKDESQIQKM